MIEIIEKNRAQLEELCRKYRVKTLELFGSAAEGTFDPERSDLDFIIDFLPLQPGQRFDFYFGLSEELEALFGRRVDLVMVKAIRNPYFLRAVNQTRQMLYAA